MSELSPALQALLREALERDGGVSLARLVPEIVPIELLRGLARQHGLTPKGYRIERAPAARLMPLLVDARRPDVVEELLTLVLSSKPGEPPAADQERVDDLLARLKLRDAELDRVRQELSRCRSQAARQRDRESELLARVEAAEERVATARSEAEAARRSSGAPARATARDDRVRRVRELEREVDTLTLSEEQHRRLVAARQARIRELEEQVADLLERVPRGRKAARERPQAPRLADQFRLPHFTPGFYKSLEGRERRQIEQAIQSALLLCTEGPSYPGLEVKQIEGQELWSMRASLKLRVYFVFSDNGSVEFVAVADREDQHTTLRRLKER